MANTFRATGEAPYKTIRVAVAAGVVIEVGDVMYLAGSVAQPASMLADLLTLVANQEAIHDGFLGVSHQQRIASQMTPGEVVIGTTGTYEFPLRTALAAPKEVGTLFGIDEEASGTAVMRASVIEVAAENLALGRLVQARPAGATKVKLEIVSTKHLGGPQAMA